MSEQLFRVKGKMLSSGMVRAKYMTEPMTVEEIRKQFGNDSISAENPRWETAIPEGRRWDMKYVCKLVPEEPVKVNEI